MTAQPRRHHDREPGLADPRRRTSGLPPPGDDIVADTVGCPGQDSYGERLAYSVDKAARLTGLARDLLFDQVRGGDLAFVMVGRRCLITRQLLQRFLGIV